MKSSVHNGTVTAFPVWKPQDSVLAGSAVAALADGSITGKVGETFKGTASRHDKIIHGQEQRRR